MLARRTIVVVCGAVSAFALDPSLSISQYAKRNWQVEDGLPQNYVSSIVQTADGYLALGTAGGAAKFDGLRFTPIVLRNGTSREWINILFAEPGGALWIASRDAGLFRHSSGSATQNPEWKKQINAIAPLRAGGFAASFDASVWRLRDGAQSRITQGLTPTDLSWNSLVELDGGAILFAAAQGLYRLAGGKQSLILPVNGREGIPLSLHRGGNSLWLGTSNGLYRVKRDNSGWKFERIGGTDGPIVSILADRDGVVWAGAWGRGLYRLTGGRAERWSVKEGLPDDFIHSLFEDREGNLWIGSRGGLSRWKNSPVVPFGMTEGLKGNFASAVVGDPAGSLWFGTWRSGLYAMRQGGMKPVPLPEPELTMLTRALATASDGALWVATWTGLYRFDGTRWQRQEHRYPGPIRALSKGPLGELYAGTSSGVFRVHDSAEVLSGKAVNTMWATSGQDLWIGTEHGLFSYTTNGLHAIPGLSDALVSIGEDRQFRLWAATRAGGIVLIANGRVEGRFDHRHGLPDLPVYQVLDDGRSSLWLSSAAGIWELPYVQVEEVLAGKRGRFQPILIGSDEGMRSIECQNVGQPNGWKSADGALWFPTVRGFVSIRPVSRRAPGAPNVVFENVEKTRSGLAVRFTAPRLASPQQLRFRYRLEGVDPAWIEAGQERTLRYNALPPGSRRLLVSACEGSGPWSDPSVLEVTQRPLFYQTWWFFSLWIASAAAVVYAIFRWRMYLLKGRYSAVLTERNRIAREWHDTLLAGFSAISWQLDTTLKRIETEPSKARDTVELARSMVHHYRAEARRVIWDLRNDGPELDDLPRAVALALRETTRDTPIESTVEVSGQPVPLDGEVQQNLLRICQEAAANAVRHSSGKQLRIHLSFDRSHVKATVSDDGVGFDPDCAKEGHFGMAIMRERAQRFGGTLEIRSAQGAGTQVTASIPLRRS